MDKFLKAVVEYKEKYHAIKFGRLDLDKIQELTLKKLNLQNLNQLRDKYEGVAFFERFSSELLGKKAIEKILEIKLIGKRVKGNLFYNIEELEFKIITCKYGELPHIERPENQNVIFVIRQNENTFWICGIATPHILNTFSEETLNGNVLNNTNAIFHGFAQLLNFNDLASLKSAINLLK